MSGAALIFRMCFISLYCHHRFVVYFTYFPGFFAIPCIIGLGITFVGFML